MTSTLAIPLVATLAALAIAVVAENLHARRISRVARLAFGPSGRPAPWARAAPIARIAGLALATFGATALLRHDPIESEAVCDLGRRDEVTDMDRVEGAAHHPDAHVTPEEPAVSGRR